MPLFLKLKTMEIFGKHIFGTDAEKWLKLCKESKREWILKYTSQTNESAIDEFINNPKISKECKCLDCGKNGNISKAVSAEVATDTERNDNAIASNENSTKRPRATKRGKNK